LDIGTDLTITVPGTVMDIIMAGVIITGIITTIILTTMEAAVAAAVMMEIMQLIYPEAAEPTDLVE